MRAVVIGGDSMLGERLVEHLEQANHSVCRTTRRSAKASTGVMFWDLTKRAPDSGYFGDYDVMYLVAAITKVMDCESNPMSWRVNADGPVSLALHAAQHPSHKVVFISSDAVERAPHLAYARQKAYVEGVVLALGGVVVRPCRIFPDRVDHLAKLLVRVGTGVSEGLYRWEG